MAQFELYRVLPQGRRRLCAAIDGETDGIVAVRNATPVIMQAQGQRLHTAVAPTPSPSRQHSRSQRPGFVHSVNLLSLARPSRQRITTQTAARKAVLQAMMADVPPPPSFDRVIDGNASLVCARRRGSMPPPMGRRGKIAVSRPRKVGDIRTLTRILWRGRPGSRAVAGGSPGCRDQFQGRARHHPGVRGLTSGCSRMRS